MDPVPIVDQQILVDTPATLTVVWRDQDGEPHAAASTPNVVVTDAAGTTVVASTASTAQPAVGAYTYLLAEASNTKLAVLTATWTDNTGAAQTTLIEVVGNYWFSFAEAVKDEPSITDRSLIVLRRREVEQEAETIIGWSFVPRYNRCAVNGSGDGELLLPDLYLRKIRSVTVLLDGILGGTTYTFTQPELDELLFPSDAIIRRPSTKVFDPGWANVLIEYEHGWDRPPEDLKRAAIKRLRYRLNSAGSGIDDRTTSYTDPNGQTVRISPAAVNATGMPDVDAVYQRYAAFYDGGTGPASRPMYFSPEYTSVYHGLER